MKLHPKLDDSTTLLLAIKFNSLPLPEPGCHARLTWLSVDASKKEKQICHFHSMEGSKVDLSQD
jgi:hypothetical protein